MCAHFISSFEYASMWFMYEEVSLEGVWQLYGHLDRGPYFVRKIVS